MFRKITTLVGAPDLFCVAGLGLLSYGAWSVYEPLGFIVAGVVLLAAGVVMARKGGGA